MNVTTRDLASALLEIGAVKFGQFKLKLHETHPDAPLSPIYVDLRILRSFPDVMDKAADVYRGLADRFRYELLADVPTAATPIVAVMSHLTRIPMISPRSSEKSYGTQRQIDGVFSPGQRVLLVDDLITKADSKFSALNLLESSGLSVMGVVVLIDREQGGSLDLQKRGYEFASAFTLRELLDHYRDSGAVSSEDYQRTIAYLDAQ